MQVGTGKIVVLGTGGTIAGTAAEAGDNIGYRAGQVGISQLLEAVPGSEKAAGGRIEAEQIAQIDSKDMDFAVWRQLGLRCAELLADADVRGIVVTHGTDTLEETAWFLHSVLSADRPVVLASAMRPATAMAPDGPQNLLDAVTVAATPGARGVLAVAAGTIHGARHVQKVHPYQLDAFSSGEVGPVGWVEEGAVRLACGWPEPLGTPAALQARLKSVGDTLLWPRVDILMNHAGADGRIVDLLVRDGADGIVVAATGNGTVHQSLGEALQRAHASGVDVRIATRCHKGQVLPKPGDVLPHSEGLSPVKARISLLLELLARPRHRG
ncbi:asparaginase [Paracidovorax valerianellae]|uniref:asparaginase n=1 Tax=Paracidovorax valerianellae TaxID=187868 RepID=UPI000B821A87|nr:asparaginase [Paracidovorax valerianellae]MDA8447921.1 asparaginase [Paracidovorax valerianellae]